MKPRRGSSRCISFILAVAGALLAGRPAVATDGSPAKVAAPASQDTATGMPVAPGSLLVHVDPKTLSIGLVAKVGTVPLELTSETLNALDTSSEGLTPVTTLDGTLYHLQGRFQAVWVAVTDADGKLHPFCLTSLPPEVAAAAKALREGREARRAR
jgi:hypothetical protein